MEARESKIGGGRGSSNCGWKVRGRLIEVKRPVRGGNNRESKILGIRRRNSTKALKQTTSVKAKALLLHRT